MLPKGILPRGAKITFITDKRFSLRVCGEVPGEITLKITFVRTSPKRTRKALDPSMRTKMGDELTLLRKRPPASRDGADKRFSPGVSSEVRGEITLGITLVLTSLKRTSKTM